MSEESTKATEPTVSHFESEDIKVTAHQHRYCEVEMDIEVQPEAVKRYSDEALREAKKEVSVPGFRKGKAPDKLIKDNFPKLIQQCLKEILVRHFIIPAIELTKMEPFNRDQVSLRKMGELSEDGKFTFSIVFEQEMAIPAVKPEEIKLQKIEVKVASQDDVNKELEKLQFEHGQWSDITDRPIAEDDFVRVSLERVEDNGEITPVYEGNSIVRVKEENLFKELFEGLLGKSVSDVFEISMGEEGATEGENAKRVLKAHVLAHKACVPHELNDELATHQRLESLDELKQKIEAYLNKTWEEEVKKEQIEALEMILFKDYYFDVRRSFLTNMIRGYQKDLEEGGKYDPKDLESLIRSAIYNAHRAIILDKLFNDFNLELSQEDLKVALNRYILNYYQAKGSFPADVLDGSGNVELINTMARQEKAIDYLLAHSTYE